MLHWNGKMVIYRIAGLYGQIIYGELGPMISGQGAVEYQAI
jgi:hypothetical protein